MLARYMLLGTGVRELREIDRWRAAATEAWLTGQLKACMGRLSADVSDGRFGPASMAGVIDACDLWETLRRLELGGITSTIPPVYRAPLDLASNLNVQLAELARNYTGCRRISLTLRTHDMARGEPREGASVTDDVRFLSGNGRVVVRTVPYLPDDQAEILVA